MSFKMDPKEWNLKKLPPVSYREQYLLDVS